MGYSRLHNVFLLPEQSNDYSREYRVGSMHDMVNKFKQTIELGVLSVW